MTSAQIKFFLKKFILNLTRTNKMKLFTLRQKLKKQILFFESFGRYCDEVNLVWNSEADFHYKLVLFRRDSIFHIKHFVV